MNSRDAVCQARGIVSARSVVGKSLGNGIEAADAPELSHPQLAAPIFIDTDDVIRHQALRISGIVSVMLETTVALIESVETGSPAAEPQVTADVPENGSELATFAETAVARAGTIMGDPPRLPIHSIEPSREHADPQHAIRVLMNRGDLAGRETIGAARTIRIVPEPLLPKVEDVHTVRRAHPQQAGPVAVYRHDAVVAEAVRVASIMLEQRVKRSLRRSK